MMCMYVKGWRGLWGYWVRVKQPGLLCWLSKSISSVTLMITWKAVYTLLWPYVYTQQNLKRAGWLIAKLWWRGWVIPLRETFSSNWANGGWGVYNMSLIAAVGVMKCNYKIILCCLLLLGGDARYTYGQCNQQAGLIHDEVLSMMRSTSSTLYTVYPMHKNCIACLLHETVMSGTAAF